MSKVLVLKSSILAGYLKRAKLFKIDMEFFQDKPEARIWKLFKIKQRHLPLLFYSLSGITSGMAEP
ncbi:hypothetical protein ABE292_004557 [Escherichia coli]|nr:hypothetical protein [Escherichia coli]EFI8247161.1 hypothetical protein [Escherichia coli]EIF1202799.1 hypothetical protein [Escherichia coli]ELQ9217975.1 hypothetical protein [Escherichia coli]